MSLATNPTEVLVQRRLTEAQLAASGQAITLERPVWIKTSAGGYVETAPQIISPQLMLLIPFKRRLTNMYTNTTDGDITTLTYALLLRWNADVLPKDRFEVDGGRYEVERIEPDRAYRTICQVFYSGPPHQVCAMARGITYGGSKALRGGQLRGVNGRFIKSPVGPGLNVSFFDTIGPIITASAAMLPGEVRALLEWYAEYAENYMKDNAPWEDRTGAARDGLSADVRGSVTAPELVLYHTVSYGVWLEIRWNGRYAIIGPTIDALGPDIMLDVHIPPGFG